MWKGEKFSKRNQTPLEFWTCGIVKHTAIICWNKFAHINLFESVVKIVPLQTAKDGHYTSVSYHQKHQGSLAMSHCQLRSYSWINQENRTIIQDFILNLANDWHLCYNRLFTVLRLGITLQSVILIVSPEFLHTGHCKGLISVVLLTVEQNFHLWLILR